jgi:hypothetical protein
LDQYLRIEAVQAQGRGELHFTQPDPGSGKPPEGLGRLFEFHGLVTAVQAQADALPQVIREGHLVEKKNGIFRGLQNTSRFRLQGQDDLLAAGLPEEVQVFEDPDQIAPDQAEVLRADVPPESDRHG